MNPQEHEKMLEEVLRYRIALGEARARIEQLEKYIVDELLKRCRQND